MGRRWGPIFCFVVGFFAASGCDRGTEGWLAPSEGGEPARTKSSPGALPEIDRGTAEPPPPAPGEGVCLPVYLEGSCPRGCARVLLPPHVEPGQTRVRACGLEHRVEQRSGAEDQATLFLVPIAPEGTRYVGPRCSAAAPSPALCEGRCRTACPEAELTLYFAR